jgi:periplasmic copper chaperone A
MKYSSQYTSLLYFSRFTLMLALAAYASTTYAKEATPPQKTQPKSVVVSIQNAWVRPTSAGQEVGAAYMTLTSNQDVNLVHVDSDVTKNIEIHSMVMKNGVMKMRMLESLPLKATTPYKLEPGGFHLMLFDLKKPLTEGAQVNLELTFKNQKNVEFKQKIKASVKALIDESSDNNNAHEHNQHEHQH